MPIESDDLFLLQRGTDLFKTKYSELTQGFEGGAPVTISETAPVNPDEGDLWYCTDDGRLYVFYDDGDTQQWVDASPPGSGGGEATELTYEYPGSGFEQTIQSRLEHYVSVKDFGAKGDGVTDDTVAIQAALSSVQDKNKWQLFFPPGLYIINKTLEITKDQGFISGAGTASTFIRVDNVISGIGAFHFNRCKNIGIQNLSVDVKDVTANRVTAFDIDNAQSCFFSNIDVYNCYESFYIHGTKPDGCNTINLNNIKVRNPLPGIGNAIEIDECVDLFVSQFTCNAPAGAKYANGIFIKNCQAAWFSDIDVLNGEVGLLLSTEKSTDVITWLFFSQCAFDKHANEGIRITQGANGSLIKGVNFVNCWSSSNGGVGFNMTTTQKERLNGINITHHTSVNNGLHGVVFNGSDLRISNSIIAGNSQDAVGTYNGIQVQVDTSDFSIVNNTIGEALLFGTTHSRNILIPTGSSDNYIISNNKLNGFTDQAIIDNGTGANKVVGSNLPL